LVKKTLKFLFFLAIGAGLIYLIVRGITPEDWANIKIAAIKANYFWVVLAMAVSGVSHWLRALRWKMLIEPTGKAPKISNTFFSVMIGYMANYAPLPRLGEVYRCALLSRYEKIPFVAMLGTVIVERVIDTLLLGVLFFVMLFVSFSQVYPYIKAKSSTFIHDKLSHLEHSNLLLIGIVVVILAVIVYIYIKKKDAIWGFAGKYIKSFGDGLKSVAKLKRPGLFWFYSIAIWVCYLLGPYLYFFCFEETSHLTVADALVVLIFGTVGIIITPGGTGAYQILVIKVLTRIFLISFTISFTFAWITWGSQLLLIVILGLISLLLLPLMNKNEEDRGNTVQNS
jgi:uncharacterized protein (TIRG00374 family)